MDGDPLNTWTGRCNKIILAIVNVKLEIWVVIRSISWVGQSVADRNIELEQIVGGGYKTYCWVVCWNLETCHVLAIQYKCVVVWELKVWG